MAVIKNYQTMQLERELLCILMKDLQSLRRYHSQLKIEWFTTKIRKEIFEVILNNFKNYSSTTTKDVLMFELSKSLDLENSLDVVKYKEYEVEYNQIISNESCNTVDLLIDKLNEAILATDISGVIDETYLALQKGETEVAFNKIKEASLSLRRGKKVGEVVALHRDASSWKTQVQKIKSNPELFAGIKTGFRKFDDLTGGLFPAELTIVFALSGKGKSTVLKNMASRIRQQGFNVLHVCNEENEFQVRTKYMSLETHIEYKKFKRGLYSEEEWKALEEFNKSSCEKKGEIYIVEIPQQTDSSLIEQAVVELELKGIHIDVIVVDYLDLMAPTSKAYNENDEQGKVTNDLKQLAINCNCAVLTATQAGTQTEKQETKEKPFLTQADIFGTKRKAHSANVLIGLVNQTATVGVTERDISERKLHRLVFCVPKNRDGATFTFRQLIEAEYGRIIEDPDDDDPWGKNVEADTQKMMDGEPAVEITKASLKKQNDVHVKSVAQEIEQKLEQIKQVEQPEKTVSNEIQNNENEKKIDQGSILKPKSSRLLDAIYKKK